MAVNLSPVGGVAAQFFTNNAVPLSGGKLFTYAAGTSTPQASYTTSQGNIAHSNPIILDAGGRIPGGGEVWITDGLIYKFVLKDANDVLIATYDNITGINSNFVAFTNSQEIQTATAGQTVFTLTTMQYQVGTNSLSVFVDGVNQYGPGAQYAYTETSSTVVTFVSGLHVGAEVKFTTTQQQGAGAVDASQVSYTLPVTGAVPTNVEARLAQVVSVKDFGAVGDGVVDDTAAIQAAIDTANWTFQTNTVITESTATPVCIFFPTGTYRTTSKLRLAPGLQLVGYSGGIHARTMEQTNFAKKGVTIYVDYDNEVDYAIDTSGYAGSGYGGGGFVGQRIDNYPANGSSTASNTYAGCPGMRFENISFQAAPGRQVRGMNLGLVPMLVMQNVQVHGFIVGIRIGGCWGGQLSNVRIDGPYGWRPLVLGTDVNNTTLTNVYISGQNNTGFIYTPPIASTIGDQYWTEYEGVPATYSWITRADLEKSHGIWCRYARVGAATVTIESVDVGIGLRDSKGDFDGVYMEGIADLMVADYGSGYGSKIDFTEVRSCSTANVLSGIDSFTQVHLPESVEIDTVIGGDNVDQWSNPYTPTVPVVTGRNKLNTETIPSFAFHAYNDGILFTDDSTASTTISGAVISYDATDGLIVDERDVGAITFSYRGAEKMKLDGIDTSTTTLSLQQTNFVVTAAGGSASIATDTDGLVFTNSTYSLQFYANPTQSFHPAQNNVISLGRNGNRWTEVFAVNGTINTSDEREKQQIRDLLDVEKAVALRLKKLVKTFKFNHAVEKKGSGARIHVGVIAQEVKEAFAAEGLDAHQYGIFCYDKWDDEFDKDGKLTRAAGDSYGVRYDELLAFIIAAI